MPTVPNKPHLASHSNRFRIETFHNRELCITTLSRHQNAVSLRRTPSSARRGGGGGARRVRIPAAAAADHPHAVAGAGLDPGDRRGAPVSARGADSAAGAPGSGRGGDDARPASRQGWGTGLAAAQARASRLVVYTGAGGPAPAHGVHGPAPDRGLAAGGEPGLSRGRERPAGGAEPGARRPLAADLAAVAGGATGSSGVAADRRAGTDADTGPEPASGHSGALLLPRTSR